MGVTLSKGNQLREKENNLSRLCVNANSALPKTSVCNGQLCVAINDEQPVVPLEILLARSDSSAVVSSKVIESLE